MPVEDTITVKDIRNDHEILVRQDHERRITVLEVTMGTLASKMDTVDSKMDKVKESIDDGNKENRTMLNTINNRMIDEYFTKKRITHSNIWKLFLGLAGGGGFLYLLIDKVISIIVTRG